MEAKEPVLGPHACTFAPTGCGQRTPAACHKNGRPGQVACLPQMLLTKTPCAPPRDALLTMPQCAALARKSVRLGIGAGLTYPHPRAQEARATGPGYRPQGRAPERGRVPNPRHPPQRQEETPPGPFPPTPRQATPSTACKPKGRCQIPTPAHPHSQYVGSGPRLPAPRKGSRGRVSI